MHPLFLPTFRTSIGQQTIIIKRRTEQAVTLSRVSVNRFDLLYLTTYPRDQPHVIMSLGFIPDFLTYPLRVIEIVFYCLIRIYFSRMRKVGYDDLWRYVCRSTISIFSFIVNPETTCAGGIKV